MTTPDRDDLPMVTCDECGEEFTEIEMVGKYCIDCTILMQRLNERKKKGYKNDIHSSDETPE